MNAFWWVYIALGLVLLSVVFACAKLIGFVSWPWWAVCIPLYPVVALIVLAIVAVCAMTYDGMTGNWH